MMMMKNAQIDASMYQHMLIQQSSASFLHPFEFDVHEKLKKSFCRPPKIQKSSVSKGLNSYNGGKQI
jgi:hypothetical protein